MPVRITTPMLAALAALSLAACGGDGQPTADVRGGTVAIALDDFLIRPQHVRVAAGQRLTIRVTNRGRLAHTWRLRGRTRNVLAITTIRPGETKTATANLGRGTYTMYCALGNHEELGMYGTFQVK